MEFFLIVLLAAIFIGIGGIRIIKQQDVAIVETFGKYSRTLDAGINWIIPVIQRVSHTVSIRIHEIRASVEVKTSDNMFVQLPVSIMIVPDSQNVANAYYKLQNPNEQVKTWVLNSVRSIASNMTLQDLFSDKEHIVTQVREVISSKLTGYGYNIEAVLVDQPTVSDEVQRSFNRVVAAKRETEAATQEGEAIKIRAIALAEAEAQSQRVRAKGMADAREILAKGLSDSVKILETNDINIEQVVNTLVELNRLDVMREVGNKGNMILMDMSSKDNPISSATLALLAKEKK